jgi:hypothetical protein
LLMRTPCSVKSNAGRTLLTLGEHVKNSCDEKRRG